jgi:hypothetical protein
LKQTIPPTTPRPDLGNVVIALNNVIDSQKRELTALAKVSDDQKGKIDRQKKYISEVEKRNADLVQKAVTAAANPPKPIANKVDPKVAGLNKTVKEQTLKINRQKTNILSLEKQNTKLKKMIPKSVQTTGKGGQPSIVPWQGGSGPCRQKGEQGEFKPTLDTGTWGTGGHAQRQLPPHLNVGSSASSTIDSTFMRSVDNLIASLGDDAQKDGNANGPEPSTGLEYGSSAANAMATQCRTGANRIAVTGRSLWERLGSVQVEAEKEVDLQVDLEQEQEQRSGEGVRIKTEEGEIEGDSTQPRWDEWDFLGTDQDTWGPDYAGQSVSGWGPAGAPEGDWSYEHDGLNQWAPRMGQVNGDGSHYELGDGHWEGGDGHGEGGKVEDHWDAT